MDTRSQNPPPLGPDAPRPGSLRVVGARAQIYAQNHPAGYALRCAALAGGLAVFLAIIAASPTLADSTGISVPSLVVILIAVLVAVLATGFLTYFRQKRLPRAEEADPFRYASARLQAATGELGPDGETNRLARALQDHLVRVSNPGFYVVALLAAVVFAAFLPLADVAGPGFQAENLVRPEFLLVLLVSVLVVYYSTKTEHDRFEAFRSAYDRHYGAQS